MSNSPVGVRLATPEDLRFVSHTFFTTVLKSGVPVNQLPYAIYRSGMETHLRQLLERSTVRVAFATAAPDEILGYAVTGKVSSWEKVDGGNIKRIELEVCHHVYVKSTYRMQGIARALLGSIKTYTHPATPGAGKKFTIALGLTYNPRLA